MCLLKFQLDTFLSVHLLPTSRTFPTMENACAFSHSNNLNYLNFVSTSTPTPVTMSHWHFWHSISHDTPLSYWTWSRISRISQSLTLVSNRNPSQDNNFFFTNNNWCCNASADFLFGLHCPFRFLFVGCTIAHQSKSSK